MNETLPKGWIYANISYISNIVYGKGLSTKYLLSDGKYPVFGANAIIGYYNFYLYKKPQVLISCRGANSGTMNISPPICYITSNSLVLELPDIIYNEHRFIFYSLKSVDKSKIITGSAQPQVTIDNLKDFKIPFPPLNEQKRIVAKLDQIMPRIQKVKDWLEKFPKIIKRFRQSVLTAAVTGKLTEKWRVEHPDVEISEIFRQKNIRILTHEEFRKTWNDFEIPESWNCFHLKDIAELRLGKMLDENKNVGKETEYIRNINVRWFQFDLHDLKTIKVQENEIKKLSIQDGDVFICEGGEPGRAAVWQLGKNKMIFQKALHRVRFNSNFIPNWLVYNLKVDADTDRLSKLFTGSTIKHFTGRSLADYPISSPSFEEQKEIIRQVVKLYTLADRLESHYQKAKARIDKISQSVLAKAFRGELVITEAELAEKEGRDYESAEKLLERIKEEKEKMERKKKSD
jgi:type I restriction enzyme, S subunit